MQKEWSNFIGKHKNQKVIVCGCGSSINELENLPADITIIGVNDIERKIKPNYLVVVNSKGSFAEGRWEWIENSSAESIFTHITKLEIKNPERIVKLNLGRPHKYDFDTPEIIDYHNNSPYLAVVIAYYMGFKNIGLIGVDFTHNHFFGETGLHALNKDLKGIITAYSTLYEVLEKNGVLFRNLSEQSLLEFPKMDIEDFLKIE